MSDERVIGVMGSARLAPGDPAWAVAEAVGRGLAEAGATVLTGGYGGLMAATARGAVAAGGRVIGSPMRAWTHLEPDASATELRWADDYPQRLATLLACDAVIALDGGIGTLSELAVAWGAAQTEADAPRVVAVGERWRAVLDAIAGHLVVGPEDLAVVTWAPGPAEAVAAALAPPGAGAPRPGARG